MLNKNHFTKTLLLVGDILLLYVALYLTLLVRYGVLSSDIQWNVHFMPFSIIFLVWIAIFYISGLYDLEKFVSGKELQNRIISSVSIAGVIAIAAFYFIPYFLIAPKTNLFIDLLITLALLMLWHYMFFKRLTRARKTGVLFFGLSREMADFISFIENHPQLGYKTSAVMQALHEASARPTLDPGIPILDFRSDIAQIIKERNVSLIILADNVKQNPKFVTMFYEMLPLGVSIMDFSRFYEALLGKVPISMINEAWFLDNLMELNKGMFESVKRWFDVLLAMALGAVTLVLTPLVSLLIKLESRGPVFYRQQRVGKNGRLFEIVKFRSMVADAEKSGAQWAQEKDSRVTKLGNILRKTRIDELPQLWNVFRGELSFVGPRPERPEFVEILKEKIPHYSMRHLVKPGLSGWAQVNFPYGASVEDAMEKLQYDLYYIKNRSIALELAIYLKTVATVLRRQGR